jgi:hypothetical protein
VLERLLGYRLTRVLHGSRMESEWPALWRVLHRPTPGGLSPVSSVAVTLQRHLHLAIAHPLTLRLNVNFPATTWFSTLRGREAATVRVNTPTNRVATHHRTLTQRLITQRWLIQHQRLAQRDSRAERWTTQHQTLTHHWSPQLQSSGQVPSRQFQTPPPPLNQPGVTNFFTSPTRVLGQPVTRAAAPNLAAQAAPIAAQATSRYWDQHAVSAAPSLTAAPIVEQLTDQVLRTVDQRLVAARERLSKR